MGLIGGGRRAAGDDRGAQAVLLPEGERFDDEVVDGFQFGGLFVRFAPDLAGVDHEAIESEIWMAVDRLCERERIARRRNAGSAEAYIQINEKAHGVREPLWQPPLFVRSR